MRQSNGYSAPSGGPTLEDCERLWTTIVTEVMSDAQIEIRLRVYPLGQVRPKVVVTSGGYDPETGHEKRHVWATCDLNNQYGALTYGQLHRLMYAAFARMEGYLKGQVGLWDERSEE